MTHPDDIGYARAEARQQAAEDGVMLMDEDDEWDDAAFADALMDAAIDERFGLPAWEDARERERGAMPSVVGDVPW